MSTLTYSRSHLADAAGAAAKPERKGFWRRVYEGLLASRQRRADREIAAYIEQARRPAHRRHGAPDHAAPRRRRQKLTSNASDRLAGRPCGRPMLQAVRSRGPIRP